MNSRYLYVENFDFNIDECNEFEPFEDKENPTPTSVPLSNPSSNFP